MDTHTSSFLYAFLSHVPYAFDTHGHSLLSEILCTPQARAIVLKEMLGLSPCIYVLLPFNYIPTVSTPDSSLIYV